MITKLVDVDEREDSEKRIGINKSDIPSKEEATVVHDLKCKNDASYLDNDLNDVEFNIVGSPGIDEPSDLQLAEYYKQIHSVGDII